MSIHRTRILSSLALALAVGYVVSLANGLEFARAIVNGVILAVFVGTFVAVLSWSVEISEQKGYSACAGVLAVLILNILGVLVLLLLPPKSKQTP